MPRSIWGYPGAVDKYVQFTLQLYKLGDVGGPEGGTLVQAPCDHTNRVQRGNASVYSCTSSFGNVFFWLL